LTARDENQSQSRPKQTSTSKKVPESRSGSKQGSVVKQTKAGYETNNKKGHSVECEEMTITKVGAASDAKL